MPGKPNPPVEPFERDLELALRPGKFIPDRACSAYVDDLEEVEARIVAWTYSNPEAVAPVARAPWLGSAANAVQLTTFASWEELGAWYQGLQAEKKAREVRALLNEPSLKNLR